MPNLYDLPVAKLRELAKAKGLKGTSALRKSELVSVLMETGAFSATPVESMTTTEQKVTIESKASTESKTKTEPKATAEPKTPVEAETSKDSVSSDAPPTQRRTGTRQRQKRDEDHQQQNREENRQARQPRNQQNNEQRQPRNQQNNEQRQPRNQQNNDQRQGRYQNNNEQRQQRYQQDNEQRQQRYQQDNEQRQQRYQQNNEQRQQRYQQNNEQRQRRGSMTQEQIESLENGVYAKGILELTPDGYGFIRGENYLSCDNDIYVANTQVRRFNLKTGDYLEGPVRSSQQGQCDALLYISKVNGEDPENVKNRIPFEKLTPIFPNERLNLESPGCSNAMRMMNLFAPIGKGQRGMIVSPPKAGKTSLLKEVANAIKVNHPEVHIIILLIDERPEEVTDFKEFIQGDNVEVIHSTFDELPDHHVRVAEMVLDRGYRLVEQGQDCIILLDSITRLTRAYNMTINASGRTLSGGLDPAALHPPKKFFGAARNTRNAGSLTILATALVDTGSRMDDVVFEEFKGTGNMEIVLDRKMSERRIFPAFDLLKSGTRRDDLLLNEAEQEAMANIRRQLVTLNPEEITEKVLQSMEKTTNNQDFVEMLRKLRTRNVQTVLRDQRRTMKTTGKE